MSSTVMLDTAGSHANVPVRIKVVDQRGFEKTVSLETDILRVGSDTGNDLRLDQPDIAPCHLLIIREGLHYVLISAAGEHQTYLNGSPVSRTRLEHDDVITFGPDSPCTMTFLTQGVRTEDHKERHFRTLLDASKAINSSLILDEVLNQLMDSVMEITQAEKGFLMLMEPNGTLKATVGRNIEPSVLNQEVIPASRSVIQEAIESRRSVFVSGQDDPGAESMVRLRLKTVMCVPLVLHDRVIGVIYVDHRRPLSHVSRTDLEILESLADHATVAIGNARLNERMLLAERLSAVGRMVSSIIHDLRGPITSIRAVAQLIEGDPNGPKVARWAEKIQSEVDRMTDMTREVLDYCRGRMSLTRTPCCLSSFLRRVVDGVRDEMAARSVALNLEINADAELPLDTKRMERVLRNLFQNAADAMPDGGTITIRAAMERGKICVAVADTGSGMSDQVRRQVFEPFFSEGKPNGTGLGLAIAHRIVEAHGGEIDVESAPAAGTTVRITLPGLQQNQAAAVQIAG